MSFWYHIVRLFYVRFIWVVMLLGVFVCLFSLSEALAQSTQVDRAVAGVEEIKPLAVGDKIPEEIWQLPLSIVKHGVSTKVVRLADYRGKVIVFDYWATWCASCIATMPKMHALAHEFAKDIVLLPITYEDEGVVRGFLERNGSSQIQGLRAVFETVINGQLLKDLIPHQSLPHLAVINQYGVLELVSTPLFVNSELFGQLVRKEPYYLPEYRSVLDTTLLSKTFPKLRDYKPVYYSTVMGFQDGLMFPRTTHVDSTLGIKTGQIVNYPLIIFFQTALQPTFNMTWPNRRIMLVNKPSDYEYNNNRNPRYSTRDNSYSYEYAVPINWSNEMINDRLLSDLEEFTGYYAKVVKTNVACWILNYRADKFHKDSQANKSSAKKLKLSKPGVENDINSKKKLLVNSNLEKLAWYLNDLKTITLPPVFYEGSEKTKLDIELPDNFDDLPTLQKVLQAQGIDLIVQDKEIEMFVFSDKPIDEKDIQSRSFILERFGYVVKEVGDE